MVQKLQHHGLGAHVRLTPLSQPALQARAVKQRDVVIAPVNRSPRAHYDTGSR